jgi:hypothetical protein
MDSELTALTDSLQAGSSRLKDELEVLDSQLQDLAGAAQMPAPETFAGEFDEDESSDLGEEEDYEEESHDEDAAREDAHEEVELAQPAAVGAADDTEGARLIALNMALNGTPRDETDRYLAENFDLSDRGQLLDEVYASVD